MNKLERRPLFVNSWSPAVDSIKHPQRPAQTLEMRAHGPERRPAVYRFWSRSVGRYVAVGR